MVLGESFLSMLIGGSEREKTYCVDILLSILKLIYNKFLLLFIFLV